MSTRTLAEKIGFSRHPSRAGVAASGYEAVLMSMALPARVSDWTRVPSRPGPGQMRNLFKLQDELLTHYGEEYLSFIGPWKHLVGTEMPNFYQFIAWREQPPAPNRLAA